MINPLSQPENNIIKREKKIMNWSNALYLILSPILAPIALYFWLKEGSFNWNTIILAVTLGIFAQVSITAGYHRLFSHRTYNAHWLVRLFFLVFGAAAFEGSALQWSLDHRNHHNYVDDNEKDPYSINKGFIWAHFGWLLYKKDEQFKDIDKAGDLTRDPLVMWQYKYWVIIGVFFAFVVPALIAMTWGDLFGGLAIAGLVRTVVTHHSTFLINSLAHVMGKQTYSDSHSARDNLFTAILTFGEGYHNYHHEFPSDYRNGPRSYDYDPTKWIIKALSLLGLTWDLKTIPEEIIVRKRMQMTEKRMQRKFELKGFNLFANSDFKLMTTVKEKTEVAFKKLSELRREYQKLAKSTKIISDRNFIKLEMDVLNDKISSAKEEFLALVSDWYLMRKRVLAYAGK